MQTVPADACKAFQATVKFVTCVFQHFHRRPMGPMSALWVPDLNVASILAPCGHAERTPLEKCVCLFVCLVVYVCVRFVCIILQIFLFGS